MQRERELGNERASRGGATRGRLGGRVGRAQSVTNSTGARHGGRRSRFPYFWKFG